jgi:hypothetical protein
MPPQILPQHRAELGEEIIAVVRAGAGFGVILDAERGMLSMANALDRLVVQVHVGHFQLVGQCVRFDREAVVLRGDLDAAG